MTKNLTFESREKLLEGVRKLERAVSTTLGPKGRNVIIQSEVPMNKDHITKDGVTVAKAITLEDKVENLGCQIVKQAAQRTNDKAGDGTTTATVLARAILEEATKYIKAGSSPTLINKGIELATEELLARLKAEAIPVDENSKQLENIATISANNDLVIGHLIASAYNEVGVDGVVSVTDSKTAETYIERVEGMQIDRGYLSQYFITNPDTRTVEYDKPLIFLSDRKLDKSDLVMEKIIDPAFMQQRPVILVAEDFDPSVLHLLIVNKMHRGLKVACIKAPSFGERRSKMLKDMAILTGGTVNTEAEGFSLKDFDPSHFGSCDQIKITNNSTQIIGGHGDQEALKNRIEEIRAEVELNTTDFGAEMDKQRIAKLLGGVAIIHVGAHTEIELKEKKDRIDDAIRATRAALMEGIIPGGGYTLYQISNSLETKPGINREIEQGVECVRKAAEAPLRVILENAGKSPDLIISKMTDGKGYNALTDTYEDLLQSGVIDPLMVARVAVENASSVARQLISTEVAITNVEDFSPQQF